MPTTTPPVGEPLEPKHRQEVSDSWWEVVEARAKGPADDPQAQEARATIAKRDVKRAAVAEQDQARREAQLAEIQPTGY